MTGMLRPMTLPALSVASAAQKIADCSMEAGAEATQRVQASLKDALEALRMTDGGSPSSGTSGTPPTRRTV